MATFTYKEVVKYALPESFNTVITAGESRKGEARLDTQVNDNEVHLVLFILRV